MWRRALLAAAAVSYLICVLIMSGMQKEDLDVSMLRKLQRYNINIADIDSGRIRQQCFSRNNGFTTEVKNDKATDVYDSTTENNDSTINTDLPAGLNLDVILDYLKSRKNSFIKFDDATTEKPTTVHQHLVIPRTETEPALDMNLLRRFIEIQSRRDSNSQAAKYNPTTHINDSSENENVPLIDKLFKNYKLYKQKTSGTTTTTEKSRKFTVDMQSIYKQIDEIMENGSQAKKFENETIEKKSDKAEQIQNQIYIANPSLEEHHVYVLKLNKTDEIARSRLLKSFNNFLREVNQLRNDSNQELSSDSLDLKEKTEMFDQMQPYIQKYRAKYQETTTYKLETQKEQIPRTLTSNIVKEIAETVKDVIIKDLRNELSNIYFKTTQTVSSVPTTTSSTTSTTTSTTTTTERIFQTRPFNNNTQVGDISIIDKFMELYKEIKSLKQATLSMKPNNESEILVNNLKQEIKFSTKNNVLKPIITKQYIPGTEVAISSIGKYNNKQFFNKDPYLPMKEKIRAVPITIQTNSVEIQPLAVPLSKPESLIRQNIVVESGYPFQVRHLPKDVVTIRNRHLDILSTNKNRTYKYIPKKFLAGQESTRYPIQLNSQAPKHREEDVIRFKMRDRGNSRFDTDYYEKIYFENNQNPPNDKHVRLSHHSVPRYHERLEGTDAGSDAVPNDINKADQRELSELDVPSRQQLSLVDMKKGSSYNDSHFKNFLKTQQKVTDMLERILATRPKTNTPQSVETV